MKTWGKLILAGIAIGLMLMTFFSPVVIAFLTGNWWYIFLFSVSWIPTWAEVLIIGPILEEVYDK